MISLSTVPTLVEEASIDERTTCEHLLSVMGIEDYDGEPNLNTILELLAHSLDSSASIVSAVDGARESARRARETISTDFWTAIKTTWWGIGRSRSMRAAELIVISNSLVATGGEGQKPQHQSWEQLSAVADVHSEYLLQDEWVRPPQDLLGEVRPLKEQAQAPSEYARAICDFLHQRLAYLPGSTTVNHTAADSWAAGSGVCQDFAHVSIGLLREAGIPAHRHVVVARGRSYPDCPPLRGIYSSGGQSELFVSVEITRVH